MPHVMTAAGLTHGSTHCTERRAAPIGDCYAFDATLCRMTNADVDLDVFRFTWSEEATMLARIAIAAVGGVVIGFERRRAGKSAGMRTLMLVSMGAALFTLISIFGFVGHDPSRVASGIVAGIGFLGAGAILREGHSVRGLTTAASIWVAAAVGAAAGTGLYLVAVGTALLAALVMGLWPHDVGDDDSEEGTGSHTKEPARDESNAPASRLS